MSDLVKQYCEKYNLVNIFTEAQLEDIISITIAETRIRFSSEYTWIYGLDQIALDEIKTKHGLK